MLPRDVSTSAEEFIRDAKAIQVRGRKKDEFKRPRRVF
jgi:hypothetical protein